MLRNLHVAQSTFDTNMLKLSKAAQNFLAFYSKFSNDRMNLESQMLALLLMSEIREQRNKLHTFLVRGSDDLKVLLPNIQFDKQNKEAFLLLYAHARSVGLYFNLENNLPKCFLFIAQDDDLDYLLLSNITGVLLDYFPRAAIFLMQNQSIAKANEFILEGLKYCALHGKKIFSELERIPKLDPAIFSLPAQVRFLVPGKSPVELATLTISSDYWTDFDNLFTEKYANISIEEIEQSMNAVQGLHLMDLIPFTESLYNIVVIPDVKTKNWKMVVTFNNVIHFSQNNFLFYDSSSDCDAKNCLFNHCQHIEIECDKENHQLIIKAKNIAILEEAIALIAVEHQCQRLALKKFIIEAKNVIHEAKNSELAINEMMMVGMWPDHIFYALKDGLEKRSDVFVLGNLYLIPGQQKTLADLTVYFKSSHHYVVFSLAVTEEHQIAVIIDNHLGKITIIDSKNMQWNKAVIIIDIQNKLSVENKKYEICNQLSYFPLQKDNWSCGIRTIGNCLIQLNAIKSKELLYLDFGLYTQQCWRAVNRQTNILKENLLQKNELMVIIANFIEKNPKIFCLDELNALQKILEKEINGEEWKRTCSLSQTAMDYKKEYPQCEFGYLLLKNCFHLFEMGMKEDISLYFQEFINQQVVDEKIFITISEKTQRDYSLFLDTELNLELSDKNNSQKIEIIKRIFRISCEKTWEIDDNFKHQVQQNLEFVDTIREKLKLNFIKELTHLEIEELLFYWMREICLRNLIVLHEGSSSESAQKKSLSKSITVNEVWENVWQQRLEEFKSRFLSEINSIQVLEVFVKSEIYFYYNMLSHETWKILFKWCSLYDLECKKLIKFILDHSSSIERNEKKYPLIESFCVDLMRSNLFKETEFFLHYKSVKLFILQSYSVDGLIIFLDSLQSNLLSDTLFNQDFYDVLILLEKIHMRRIFLEYTLVHAFKRKNFSFLRDQVLNTLLVNRNDEIINSISVFALYNFMMRCDIFSDEASSIVKFIEDCPDLLNMTDAEGDTILSCAILKRNLIVFNRLLKFKSIDINKAPHGKYFPLILAAQDDQLIMIRELLKAGAEIDKKMNDSGTALFMAAQNGHVKTVEFLLEKNADPFIPLFISVSSFLEFAELNSVKEKATKILEQYEFVNGPENAPYVFIFPEDIAHIMDNDRIEEIIQIVKLSRLASLANVDTRNYLRKIHCSFYKLMGENYFVFRCVRNESWSLIFEWCEQYDTDLFILEEVIKDNKLAILLHKNKFSVILSLIEMILSHYPSRVDSLDFFIKNYLDLINTDENKLIFILKNLSKQNHIKFLSLLDESYLYSMLKTIDEMIEVLKILPEDQYDNFFIHIMGSSYWNQYFKKIILDKINFHRQSLVFSTKSVALARGNAKITFENEEHEKIKLFHDACEKSDLILVSKLLIEGMDPNISGCYGFKPLHWAAINNDIELAALLLAAGADLMRKNSFGDSPVHWAAWSRSLSVLEFFVEQKKSINLNELNFKGKTPLLGAMLYGYVDVVKFLLKKGALPAREESSFWLIFGITHGILELVEESLKKAANIHAKLSDYRLLIKKVEPCDNNLLSYALNPYYGRSNPKIIELLLQYGANVNGCPTDKFSPLASHVRPKKRWERADYEIMEMLLDYGANPNFRSVNNRLILDRFVDNYYYAAAAIDNETIKIQNATVEMLLKKEAISNNPKNLLGTIKIHDPKFHSILEKYFNDLSYNTSNFMNSNFTFFNQQLDLEDGELNEELIFTIFRQ